METDRTYYEIIDERLAEIIRRTYEMEDRLAKILYKHRESEELDEAGYED